MWRSCHCNVIFMDQLSVSQRMTTVHKIGGANMVQLDVINNLTDVLEKRNEHIVYVVSAFEGVTNKLTTAMDQLNGTDYSEDDIDTAFTPVHQKHEEMIEKFFQGEFLEKVRQKYEASFGVIRQSLMVHKATSRVLKPVDGSFQIRDQVIGFGENMAAAFLQIYLEQQGKHAVHVEHVQADQDLLSHGEVTNTRINAAKKAGIIEALQSVRSDVIRIFDGHMRGTPRGLIPHQGRGYSDIMATNVTQALRDLGENTPDPIFWKDVDGVYTANPKDLNLNLNKPRLHEDISIAEALENASAGSGIINVRALSYALQNGMGLRIRNLKNLDPDFGTNITTGTVDTRYLFKTMVTNRYVDTLTFTIPEMADASGFGMVLMAAFAERDLSLDLICCEGTSITFSIHLPQDAADRQASRLHIREIRDSCKTIKVKGESFDVQKIEWDKEKFASLSFIGTELKDRPSVLGSISSTLGAFGINIYGVSHGKNQTRISFLIDQSNRKKAVGISHSYYVDSALDVKVERNRLAEQREEALTSTFNGD